MTITPELREKVEGEVQRFATDLNLSDDQKQKVSNFLAEAHEKVDEYREENPDAFREDIIKIIKRVAATRTAIRERLVSFFTPEQLAKRDTGVATAKEFLGQKMAA